jgi:fumarylacetoacetate (FAA) hydrolase
MKLVSYRDGTEAGRAGVWQDDVIFDAATLLKRGGDTPFMMLDLLRGGSEMLDELRAALASADPAGPGTRPAQLANLLAPVPNPPAVRDFYAFEQHVKASRGRRGLDMIPEWYQIAVFYFSNPAAIVGPEEDVFYPDDSQEVDFELEIACVIGKPGRDISAADAPAHIAGYLVMNDWSARDIWRQYEAKLSMGPAKAKDFATSLGPWLVTTDELDDRRTDSGAEERYDLAMLGRINGREVSRGNFKDIYYSFPQMIERASRHVMLKPGDVIGSGTVGTGCIFELGPENVPWLKPGDVVEMEIERLGILRNRLVEER